MRGGGFDAQHDTARLPAPCMRDFAYFYRLYGLLIGSELELPELEPLPASTTPEVAIRLGDLSIDFDLRPTSLLFLYAAEDGPVLAFSNLGRFHMVGGSTIRIEPADQS